LQGSGASSTTINGNTTADVVYAFGIDSFTIEGFTIRNAGLGGSLSGSAAIHLNPNAAAGVGNWIVRGNILQDNASGIMLRNSLGGGNALIENNLISNNALYGIINNGHPHITIRNNTIVDNGWVGYTEFVGRTDNAVVNNIITSNGFAAASSCPNCPCATGVVVGPVVNYYIAFNDVFNNAIADYGQNTGLGAGDCPAFVPSPGTGEISVDPEFQDAAHRNYRLTKDSPAVDAGTNDNAPATDLDGKSRPIDGDGDGIAVADMGAVEFSAQIPPPDTTPPVITITATPETLWPPNGKMVPVTVSGTITDAGSGVNPSTAAYVVTDEYGQVQPKGSVALRADGSYAFTIQLQAARNGNDTDGRQYIITVSAQDKVGNKGSAATGVIVPHDQG
jgi:hypothetical protein